MAFFSTRTLLLAWVLLHGCGTTRAETPVAADIAVGTTTDEVTRTLGWPTGRTTAGDREAWSYPHVRVLFEGGRVISVFPLRPPARRSHAGSASPPPAAPSLRRTDTRAVPGDARLAAPIDRVGTPSKSAPTASSLAREQAITARPSSAAIDAAPPPAPGFRTWEQLLSLCILGFVCIGLIVVAIKLRQKITNRIHATCEEEHDTEAPDPLLQSFRRRRPRVHSAPSELTLDKLLELEWKRIEELAAHFFAAQGWRATYTGNGADGGVDVVLTRVDDPHRRAYVQCKAYNSDIDVKQVRELFGVMAADGVAEGWFFTTRGYSRPALDWAAGKPLHLVSGPEIVRTFATLPETDRNRILTEVFRGDYRTPSCPKCGTKMVKKGSGNPFWGCPRFPTCRSQPIQIRSASSR